MATAMPEPISPLWTGAKLCAFADRWRISFDLASRLVVLSGRLPWRLGILSGYRTDEEQRRELERKQGRNVAPVNRSTHTTCPATGADLFFVDMSPVDMTRARFGRAVIESGLRWGGGSRIDPATGIPSDWNHVDLGPRQ